MNSNIKSIAEKLIVALDFSDANTAKNIAKELAHLEIWFKVGLELYLSTNGQILEDLKNINIFLDLKFHDIPNTVKGACFSAVKPNVKMLNVHASGGKQMMLAARKAINEACEIKNIDKPKLIAVTLLTSIDKMILLNDFGLSLSTVDIVKRLSYLAKESGMDGVVAAGHETEIIKATCGKNFLVITPGIRQSEASSDDQKRVQTPYQAIKNGSDYLVIGRNITAAENRLETTKAILEEMKKAMSS